MSRWRIRQYIRLIQQGAIFAYPTDTIWGLGCHPLLEPSIRRIQQVKKRDAQKGLILLGSHISQFSPFIDQQNLVHDSGVINQPHPSPVTWIVKTNKQCPYWLTKNGETIALRLTSNAVVKQICDQIQLPLISTSANFSGHPPARNSVTIYKHFRHKVDFVIHGPDTGTGKASQIRDASNGKILRA